MGLPNYLPDFDDDAPTRAVLFPAHVQGRALDVPASEPDSCHDNYPLLSEGPVPAAVPIAPPPSSSGRHSVIRVRVPVDPDDHETRASMRALSDHHVALAKGIAWAYAQLEQMPRDPATRAASATLAARLADLGDVRDAISDLFAVLGRRITERDAVSSGVYPVSNGSADVASLYKARAPLTMHLEVIYSFLFGALEALSDLAEQLTQLEADWVAYRERIADAAAWMTGPTAQTARNTLWTMADEEARTEITAAFDELTFALHMLGENLQHRFG
jgi:hypothetical protein